MLLAQRPVIQRLHTTAERARARLLVWTLLAIACLKAQKGTPVLNSNLHSGPRESCKVAL